MQGLLQEASHLQASEYYAGIGLRCPRCKSDLPGRDCASCGLRMNLEHGILHALPPERAAHFARFSSDYERIRQAEGRGSTVGEYYRSLPYTDVTGANTQQWHIRARSFDHLINHVLDTSHDQKVLDIGAGNCWLSYRLAMLGHRPVAVDLLTNNVDGLGAAAHYQCDLPELFPRVQSEFVSLPFQGGYFDVAIYNASFHYAEDYEASLQEAFRCLRPGGMAVICDTAWYSQEDSGKEMVRERHACFQQRYGNASDSIQSMEFLTPERLRALEDQLSIRWTVSSPWYGLKWAIRPLVARLLGRREPSRFRIYSARKDAFPE